VGGAAAVAMISCMISANNPENFSVKEGKEKTCKNRFRRGSAVRVAANVLEKARGRGGESAAEDESNKTRGPSDGSNNRQILEKVSKKATQENQIVGRKILKCVFKKRLFCKSLGRVWRQRIGGKRVGWKRRFNSRL